MRLCLAIKFCNRPCCWIHEHRSGLPLTNGSQPHRKLEMIIRNNIQTKAIEVNIQSTGIVEEEQIYILSDDEDEEYQLWQEKPNVRNQAQNKTHNEPENSVTELQNFHKPTSGLNTCSESLFKDYARIRLE